MVLRATLYPNCYVWLLFLSSLDIMFTSIILQFGGSEVNPLVNWVLTHGGLVGVVGYKFLLIAFVMWACEVIGRRRDEAGRRLAEWSVAITLIPVYLALAQLVFGARHYAG